jgi:uncharacterized protein
MSRNKASEDRVTVDTAPPRINEIARAIVRHFDPKRIILFGSHARGEAHEDSDVDLFVEMESDKRPPERAIEISRIFGLRTWPLDLVVYTPQEVDRLRTHDVLLSEIEHEGKVLYERR